MALLYSVMRKGDYIMGNACIVTWLSLIHYPSCIAYSLMNTIIFTLTMIKIFMRSPKFTREMVVRTILNLLVIVH